MDAGTILTPQQHDKAPGLHVEPLGGGRFRVSGGAGPHLVVPAGPDCDCPSFRWHPGRPCKHLRAVEQYLAERGAGVSASERPTVEAGPGLDAEVSAPGGAAALRLTTPAVESSRDAAAPPAFVGPTDESAARAPRHVFRSLGELLTLPPPSWRLENLLPFGGLAVLYGPPGAGKSFLTLAWGLSIAAGRDWLGRRVLYGPVVYVAGEGTRGLGLRAQTFLDAHELAPPDLEHEFFAVEAVNLLDPAATADFIADIQTCVTGAPGLIVLDTLARVMSGGDENSARDVGLVVAAADRLRRATGATVLVLHHTQKVGELERGSGALRGAADTMLALTNEDNRLTLTVTKQRDAELGAPLNLRLAPVSASCLVQPLDAASEADTVGRTSLKVLEAVQTVALDGETTVRQVLELGVVPKASVYRSLKLLHERGYIEKRGKRYALTVTGARLVSHGLN